MNPILQIFLAIIGSGAFASLITGLLAARQRRLDRNDQLSNSMTRFETKLDNHIKENELQFIQQDRARIIAFADECSRKVSHSKEAFDDILASVDRYEDYCSRNPTYSNNKCVIAISIIKAVYEHCLTENKFI